MTQPFGLSPFGFRAKRLNDIKTDLDNQFTAQFGDVNLAPQSVIGQIIGVWSKVLADIWENLEQVYFSQYPNSADGVALDNVVQFNAITRLPQSQTLVYGVCAGIEGTVIPQNALARIPSTNQVFFANIGGIISSSNAYFASVTSDNPPIAQQYTAIISGKSFVYSRPILTFSNTGAVFVSGNVIKIALNGVPLTPVPFNTNSNQTLTDVLNAILAFPTVDPSTSKSNPGTINIFSVLGQSTTITSVLVEGAGAPTFAITFSAPPSMNAISQRLAALINNAGENYAAVDLTGGNFTVQSTISAEPFDIAVGNGMEIIAQSSPISFLAEDAGPIACPPDSLTEILTPVAGWDSIINPDEGVLGRFVETDAELRLRRLKSLRLLGRGTVEAIRAQLLAVGATSALVFENRTMLQEPSSFTISSDLSSGDSITIELNGISQTPIPFTTNSATTMQLLADQIELFPGVSSAIVGGTGNRTIDITFTQGYEVFINSIIIAPSVIGVIITNGRPPKSFEAVVQGQTDAIIAQTIWFSKPAGIQTFGNTQQPIIDSQGETQQIFFSRPTQVYISIQCTLTLYSEETFPSDGLALVKQVLIAYINNLGVGADVLIQRVQAQVFKVPGIASSAVLLAATASPTESPSFSAADIPIGDNQIAITLDELVQVTL